MIRDSLWDNIRNLFYIIGVSNKDLNFVDFKYNFSFNIFHVTNKHIYRQGNIQTHILAK